HGVEVDRVVAELTQLGHLLVEAPDRDGDRVLGDIVHLVVHEHAERPLLLAVDRADAGRGLADRAVDAVLQRLLDAVGTHAPIVVPRPAPPAAPRTPPAWPPRCPRWRRRRPAGAPPPPPPRGR